MKIVIDIPPRLLERVREVVEQGDYDDPQEFVTISLMNQVEIEDSNHGTDETLSLDQAMYLESDRVQPDGKGTMEAQQSSNVQNVNLLERGEYHMLERVDAPDRTRLVNGPLWGQYNRLFPVKLTLRRLANYLRDGPAYETGCEGGSEMREWAEADQFKDEVASVARDYGTKIAQVDERRSRTRTNRLATGLPVGDDPQKSKGRFKRQFVGAVDQSGGIGGAPPSLLFVNFPMDPAGAIGITEAGLKFAKLRNPLLDDGVDAERSLSDDEIEFYLAHIREQVPDEHRAMEVAATAIAEGIDRPDSLTDQISTLNDEWSDTHANTVRSGLVSRMVELGLVARERVGQRGIAYQLTDSGEKIIKPNTKHE